jgi:type II secretory pathway component PulK
MKIISHGDKTPKQALGMFRSKLRGFIPSASRDCEVRRQVDSTCQFRCAALSELEFHNKQIQSNRGVALITVLLIISILIAVAIELNRSSRAEIYEAANISDGILLTCIAKSGFYGGAALLVSSSSDVVSLRDGWANTAALAAKSTSLFPDGYFVVNIEDEAGKIPVNKLVNGNEYNPDIKDILIRLLIQPEFGLDERRAADIVDSIKD